MAKAISLAGMRSFVAVVDAGGVRAAAEHIGRTPSAVSMTLKQLEDDVGAALFEGDRHSNLSPIGRVVLEESRAMIAHYERACSAIATLAADNLGRCDVASVPSVATTLLTRAIANVRANGAPFDIHVRDIDTSAIVAAIDNGVVEIGLCADTARRPDLAFTPLFREPIDFVCRTDNPLAHAGRPIDWRDLSDETIILNGSVTGLGLAEVEALARRSKLTASNVASNLALVGAGLGVTFLPRLCRWRGRSDIAFLPMADTRAARTVGWIARVDRALQPASRKLLAEISNVSKNGQEEFGYVAI